MKNGNRIRQVFTALVALLTTFPQTVSSLAPSDNLLSQFQNQMILAPLTKGGNLPFRRLCADFGMKVSMGEMVYAKYLLKGEGIEKARLRRAPNEEFFGVQIATNDAEEGRAAMAIAAESGADFCDLNCGCPIYEATRRGLGSALMRSPTALGKLVEGMREGSSIPLSVKIRLGRGANSINALETVQQVRQAGAGAVTIHGRTAIQGYSKAANWELIQQIVEENNSVEKDPSKRMPVVGNGDVFTHYEAQRRMDENGVDGVMVGRGALIKPWIFQEFRDKQAWEPDLSDRIAVYRRLASYMKEHFGDDEMGRKKAWNFLPWHLDFFRRYIALPEDEYGSYSEGPLIQMRLPPNDEVQPLELLLSHRSKRAHDRIAAVLWEADSDSDAVAKLTTFAESADFEEIKNNEDEELEGEETKELSNIRKEGGGWHKRRRRNPKPKRTPEEIEAIRAERAAKKARLALLEKSEAQL